MSRRRRGLVGVGVGRGRQLAVDLGTANTVVFERGEGIVAFEPSVVAVDERTGEVYAVGAEAHRMIGRTPAHIRATRPLRHGVIADFETTAAMLRYFIHGAVGRHSRAQVVVCVPSGVTPVERTAVEDATLASGATHAHLIDEPLAAAIGAGLPVAESTGSLIVDVGGGTSEMAVTSLGDMVVARSLRVGGYDFDEAIAKLVQDEHRLLVGQEQAEAAKIEIGAATNDAAGNDEAEIAGRDLTTGLLRRSTITAAEVQKALTRPLNQITEAVELLLEQTPPQLAADIADHGLTLVGGGALLRGFADLLRVRTGLRITIDDDPLTTVARGAGRALEDISRLPTPKTSRRRRRR